MSWSVQLIGTTAKVAEALTAQAANLSGQSKEEYEKALPLLVGIVNLNFASVDTVVKVTANGHGYSANGQMVENTLNVDIQKIYGFVA
jgi:hypothetical protein